ncbi:LIM and calponin homology domains-containing protein 1-like isoform X8 [Etheostoma cragini]|uniref:LIM and calponin homology domains-containing protein 1-like isoform X8 n=1 Tax=Etheostoma cragini TaxID=417921 RepID=UPI00155DF932|nr:LIM and calponin homology domains-containing protein 1-like isoform X8 [Etheostoma cragini]
MASPVADIGQSHQHHPVTNSAADSAFQEAQTWIEAATGRCFGDKDFRGGLENGILLCELLSSIKPGLVKKINRLPTPVAGLDNLSLFLRGCEELGLKGSQLFDPGDLQDTSTRPTAKGSDCSQKLKNVLITIYWLGRAANSCTSYNGPTLDLKEFEGLLSQMRKEAEEAESPQRSVRDSGYIDCWDSERSDSLSPPRHGREDSFDSLDSFGSRSQQTPSPDVLVARGSSDGRGSDSESDGPPHRKIPDIRKDDMLARRTSISEPRTAMPFNQYLPNKSNQSGYLPTPLRKKKNDKEDGARKSWSTATSPVGGDRPLSPNELPSLDDPPGESPSLSATPPLQPQIQIQKKNQTKKDDEEGKQTASTLCLEIHAAGLRRSSEPLPCRVPQPCAEPPMVNVTHLIITSEQRSVSMIDMRGEEEAILQPHSQVRHELMHNQYNRMKEEDDHWQDDLARWKNRRRSISQDLIKKEEERKMMEQLLSGDTCTSMRRRSIKTYREIVQDKERREDELRDAYRRARTPEEASFILQRYAQRFSISDAVLERLQLPKILDRSLSADPSFSGSPFPLSLSTSPTTPDPFDMDPNGPMKYLRQLSAPAPKFTSTLEAQIEEFPKDSSNQRPQIRSRSSEPPSTRNLSPKPVPLLTPRPYFHSGPTTAEPWPSKADGFLRVNGIGSDDFLSTTDSQGRESPPHFQASASKTSNSTVDAPSSAALPTCSTHTSTREESAVSTKAKEAQCGTEPVSKDVQAEKVIQHSTPPSRPTSLPSELQKPEESIGKTESQSVAAPEVKSSAAAQEMPLAEAKQEQDITEPSGQSICNLVQSGISTQQSQPVTLQASVPSFHEFQQRRENAPSLAAPGSFEYHPPRETTAEFANSVRSPLTTSNPKLRWEFFVPPEETEKDCRGNVSVPVLPQARRGDRWSWDPDEERKRQERWQQEQERMLQEKYQCEQEKLKEEWEKAQREVAEEERKYHEEERRILEETVTPLTPRSSALPSPSRGEVSSSSEPQDTIVRSLGDWERKQELLERHSKASTESVEWKRRENDRTSDISTADDSMKTGRSLGSQSSSQPETLGHSLHNGQKLPAMPSKTSTPVKKQEELSADSNKPNRPAGDRRSDPVDNIMCPSSSKSPTACPPPPDTLPPTPNRSVSGKKLCSSCGQPLGKGAAMIIETLSLYFHIHCFKCGVCKGQLGDTTTGTDVRIRNGLLNCHQCYIRSRSAGQPTTL